LDESLLSIKNPATGEVVASIPNGTRDDARKAIARAKAAFSTWRNTPQVERGRMLLRIAQVVRDKREELSILLTKEQGKPVNESRLEITSFIDTCEYFAGLARRPNGRTLTVSGSATYCNVLKLPVGVVAAILPWNFPVSLLGWKLAPALAAGNTMVVKPSSNTPLTDLAIGKLLVQAGVPDGVVNVIVGPGRSVGEELVENPDVGKIAFTGETTTGKRIIELAAKDLKRVTLELGGSDPMIVCDDADIAMAVEAAGWGRFRNCGQSCTSIKRLILFEKISEEFISKLLSFVKDIRVGNGLKPDTTMGPLNNEPQRSVIEELVEDSLSRGAKILTGGQRPVGSEYDKGYFYLPTLLSDVDPNSRILKEECFGPVLPIIEVKGFDEAIEVANDSIYGLGSSIWTSDLTKAMLAAERIEAGTTWINQAPKSRPEIPFGGLKQSGIGRELGEEGLEYYFETKSIHIGAASAKNWPVG